MIRALPIDVYANTVQLMAKPLQPPFVLLLNVDQVKKI
jgi:hypothetical protein